MPKFFLLLLGLLEQRFKVGEYSVGHGAVLETVKSGLQEVRWVQLSRRNWIPTGSPGASTVKNRYPTLVTGDSLCGCLGSVERIPVGARNSLSPTSGFGFMGRFKGYRRLPIGSPGDETVVNLNRAGPS